VEKIIPTTIKSPRQGLGNSAEALPWGGENLGRRILQLISKLIAVFQ